MGDEDLLEYAFDHTQTGIAVIAGDGGVIRVNPAGAAMVGYAPEDLVGHPFTDFVEADDVERAMVELAGAVDVGHAGPIELRAKRPDGAARWMRALATLLPTDDQLVYITFEDITAERAVSESLQRARAQQAAVAALGNDAMQGVDVAELCDRCTKLVVSTLGSPYAAVMLDDGHPDGLLFAAATGPFTDQVGKIRRPRDGAVASVAASRGPLVSDDLRTEDRWEPDPRIVAAGIISLAAVAIEPRSTAPGVLAAGGGEPGGFDAEILSFLESMANVLASAIDAASAVDDLRHVALHDALTGLPNRVLVLDRLDLALESAVGHGTQVAVLVCDLDRFKMVNDGMGHAAGDDVLRIVAERLRSQVRPGDTVGRFGGDEFVIVCPEVKDLESVVTIAERLGAAVSEPMQVMGADLVATVSIGIAFGSDAGPEAAAGLLRSADAAMYRAKERGRDRLELFDEEMRARAATRLRLESELRRALEAGQLRLHYQPVLSIPDHHVVGVEALIRWAHPDLGLLEPAEFLPVAGETSLLNDIGAWAFDRAAAQTAAWSRRAGWGERWVAVNLAPRELSDPRLVDRVHEACEASGVAPELLRIEITEEALVEDVLQTAGVLDQLRGMGLRVSVDDFGTGYSSLAYLKRLPVDALKLDQSFVAGLGENGDDIVIAGAVIGMAQALGLLVVAEGVETEAQLEVLAAMGCDLAQGFHFAPPLPADELWSWVAEHDPTC